MKNKYYSDDLVFSMFLRRSGEEYEAFFLHDGCRCDFYFWTSSSSIRKFLKKCELTIGFLDLNEREFCAGIYDLPPQATVWIYSCLSGEIDVAVVGFLKERLDRLGYFVLAPDHRQSSGLFFDQDDFERIDDFLSFRDMQQVEIFLNQKRKKYWRK